MNFDKNKYISENKLIEQHIKNILPKWASTQGFILDGIINPEIYSNEKFKILAFLAESYGYNKSGMDNIEDQALKDKLGIYNTKVKMARRITNLYWLIYRTLQTKKFIEFNDMPQLFGFHKNKNRLDEMNKILCKTAWVNVKKESNSNTVADRCVVYNHGVMNKDILEHQLRIIAPDL